MDEEPVLVACRLCKQVVPYMVHTKDHSYCLACWTEARPIAEEATREW